MAIKYKKISLYAITGIALAVVIIAAIFASGIQFSAFNSPHGRTGTLSESVMDAPADLTHLNVTINALYVYNDEDD
jgi:hypothetical protein